MIYYVVARNDITDDGEATQRITLEDEAGREVQIAGVGWREHPTDSIAARLGPLEGEEDL